MSAPAAPDHGLLTPASRAVAGLALAVAGLLGQNALTLGVQFLLIGPAGTSGGDWSYAVVVGLGVALPALLALVLVLGTARRGVGWPAHLARAAVLVALVVLLGAVLTVLGGVLHPF